MPGLWRNGAQVCMPRALPPDSRLGSPSLGPSTVVTWQDSHTARPALWESLICNSKQVVYAKLLENSIKQATYTLYTLE